ncbi:hypothetical protein D3C85_1933600 [compost metagenome]
MADGLDDLAVNLDIGATHGEAFGARAFDADAQDGGDTWSGVGAMDRDVKGQFEAHV